MHETSDWQILTYSSGCIKPYKTSFVQDILSVIRDFGRFRTNPILPRPTQICPILFRFSSSQLSASIHPNSVLPNPVHPSILPFNPSPSIHHISRRPSPKPFDNNMHSSPIEAYTSCCYSTHSMVGVRCPYCRCEFDCVYAQGSAT